MTSLIYMTTLHMSHNMISCDSAMMKNGKNLFNAPIYMVWEHPGMMNSKQKSKQQHCTLVTNSGKLDARYAIIPSPRCHLPRNRLDRKRLPFSALWKRSCNFPVVPGHASQHLHAKPSLDEYLLRLKHYRMQLTQG